MSKHRKRNNNIQQQKIQGAQHRNEMLRNLTKLAVQVLGEKTFRLIPERKVWLLVELPVSPPKIVLTEKCHLPADYVKDMKRYFSEQINEKHISLWADGPTISLHDFLGTGMSLFLYLHNLKEDEFLAAKEVIAAFKSVINFKEVQDNAFNELTHIGRVVGYYGSDLREELVWLDYKVDMIAEPKPKMLQYILVYSHITEKKQVCINDHVRPVLKVCWAELKEGVSHVSITPEQLNIKIAINPGPMDIYVQMHALQRLEERLDDMAKGLGQWHMFLSLVKPVVIRDKEGNILIEYRLHNFKMGYLLCDIVDGKLIIRTFLFLTNDGTPEAEKLKTITGLSKEDIKYLSMDKLSVFLDTDISSNERIKNILLDAGFSALIELHDDFRRVVPGANVTLFAEKVIKYMNLDQTDQMSNIKYQIPN